jgi:Mn-dependent DtxR family transcriptional regulator
VNARASTADLARQLGVARTTVVARLARLEREGIISGYTVRCGTTWRSRGCRPLSASACSRAPAPTW